MYLLGVGICGDGRVVVVEGVELMVVMLVAVVRIWLFGRFGSRCCCIRYCW